MIIREATPADSDAIAQLTAELGYSADLATTRARLARILGRAEDLVLVAVVDEKVVGWLQAHASDVLESGFRAEIVGLIVSKDCRRCGAGRSLVRRAEQWAVQLGAENITVRSNTQRIESHAFYPALGFAAAKTQTVYRKFFKK